MGYILALYFTISELKQVFKQKYQMEMKLCNFSQIKSQLGKVYPVETVNLFGFSEYMIPWKYMEQFMEDYHNYNYKRIFLPHWQMLSLWLGLTLFPRP